MTDRTPLVLGTHHVAVICSDYERSRHFYVEVLGLEVIAEVYREARRSHKPLITPRYLEGRLTDPLPPLRRPAHR